MPAQPISIEKIADPGAGNTAAVDAEKVDLASADIGKVDRDQVDPAITGEIAWPMPMWAADTQQADKEQVDPAITGEIAWPVPPWAADTRQADGQIVDPATANAQQAETTPAGADNADTVDLPTHHMPTEELPPRHMPPFLAAFGGSRHPLPQLPGQRVVGALPIQNPAEKKRFGPLALAGTALAALLVGALFGASRQDVGDGMAAEPVATVTATVSTPTSEPSEPSIQLEDPADSATRLEAVRVQGTYRGGADTFLRVQRLEGGDWLAFPVPTKTDQSGRFTAQVKLEHPGRYWLRVVDPNSGVASKPFVLVIKG